MRAVEPLGRDFRAAGRFAAVLAGRASNRQAELVAEVWRIQNNDDRLDAESAVALIRDRRSRGKLATCFESDAGRILAVVTNGERAMVMLLREPGDAGEHAVDRISDDSTSSGYVLDNGQVDTYAHRDTVPFAMALDLVTAVIDGGEQSPAAWQVDR